MAIKVNKPKVTIKRNDNKMRMLLSKVEPALKK